MLERTVRECDHCGREDVVGTVGGTHFYCSRHEDEVQRLFIEDNEWINSWVALDELGDEDGG